MWKEEKSRSGESDGSGWERVGITMSIVPLGKTITAGEMRLLKRTQWSLIDSLGRRGEWTTLMNGLWASEPNCLLSKNEGGIQFIELRSRNIIWSPGKHSARTERGRKRFCGHFYFLNFFYLAVILRRGMVALPRGAPGCRAGWSCPASAWLLVGCAPPASTAEWGDQCRCLGRKLPCLRSSARSHTRPLKGESIIQ